MSIYLKSKIHDSDCLIIATITFSFASTIAFAQSDSLGCAMIDIAGSQVHGIDTSGYQQNSTIGQELARICELAVGGEASSIGQKITEQPNPPADLRPLSQPQIASLQACTDCQVTDPKSFPARKKVGPRPHFHEIPAAAFALDLSKIQLPKDQFDNAYIGVFRAKAD